ncbi:MAG: PAS domain-containing sensor histidine kinase [Candidatus Melainabacteria bacterium]|nr:MAG: PAS domain-containing sensor histidine kinase [Candidatus Melainabacteria bacterium]
MKLTILQKGMIIVFVPLMVQIVCIASLYSLQSELERELDREHRSRLIVETASKTARDLYLGLDSIHKKGPFNISQATRTLNVVFVKIKENMANLTELTKDNAEESAIVRSISSQVNDIINRILASKRMVHEGNMEEAIQTFHDAVESGKLISIKASTDLLSLVDREKSISDKSPLILKSFREQQQTALATAFFVNIILAAALAIIFNRNIASRISIISDNILRLAAGRDLHERLTGSDELSVMDKAFRDMAASLSEAQEQEQAMVQNAREVICSLNSDLKFLSVNPAIELLLGYSSDELVGARFVTILHPVSIDASLEYLTEMKESASTKVLDNQVIGKDGLVRDFVWSVQWSDSRQAYFCVAHDVTETKNLEKMKQAFVSMVSHDLRSPLCSILAYTELLEKGIYGELSEPGMSSLRDVNQSISRLIDLVGDLVDIERLESGNLELNWQEEVPVERLFNAAVNSVAALAASNQISIQSEHNETMARLDEARMVQVLVNLLSNAIKFSSAQAIVQLTANKISDGIEFAVVDTGRGIPVEQLASIFERFKQVHSSDSANRRGSGLGLSICKAIVEQHGGKIGVESEVGKGSKFWIRLPA